MKGLSIARLKEVLAYDPETGLFVWLSGGRAGRQAGTVNADGYVQIKIDGRFFYAHRLALFYTKGTEPVNEVDHRNGARSDNRLLNLRDATRVFNSENVQRAHKDSRSGLLGVSWSAGKNRWYSRIRAKGRTVFLGYFKDPELAHAAYVAKKRSAHEGNLI